MILFLALLLPPDTIHFGAYTAVIDPMKSARVISFSYQDKELLTQEEVHSFNYGSTLWPSPHGEWGWPPPPHLDGQPFEVALEEHEKVYRGQRDTVTGLRFIKRFGFDPSDTSFVAHYTVENLNDTPRYVALWEVTRTPGGLSYFPVGKEKATIPSFSRLRSVSQTGDIMWYQYNRDSVHRSQKLYENGAEGWLAHVHNGMLFVKVFEDISREAMPPTHGEVEIYVHTDGSYIELENHSRYLALPPGGNFHYRVRWYYRPVPSHINSDLGSQELTTWTRKIIKKPAR